MSTNKMAVDVLAVMLLFAAVTPATAHSTQYLESQFGDREKYFQPIDKKAPEFTLQDTDGRTTSSIDLRGKVVVLHFIYTNCPDICPLHADRIAEIQEMVNQTPMKDQVRFVSVTTDPEKDTPDVMRNYGSAHGLNPVNWVFLTGGRKMPDDTTRKLAERFGHKFTVTDEGYQLHSLVTHVIDRKGRWRANFHGLKFEPTNLVLFVNALVNDWHDLPGRRKPATANGPMIGGIAGAVGLVLAASGVLLYRRRRKRTGKPY